MIPQIPISVSIACITVQETNYITPTISRGIARIIFEKLTLKEFKKRIQFNFSKFLNYTIG